MPYEIPHPDMTPVIQNVLRLVHCLIQQLREASGNSQPLPGKWCVSILAGERDSTQGGSSVVSTIEGTNSSPSSSLNNSRMADISQRVNSTLSGRLQWSINAPTSTPGSKRRCQTAPGGTSKRYVVFCSAFGICITPIPLSCVEILPTAIPNAEARAIILKSL
jgi:hypothetical protein